MMMTIVTAVPVPADNDLVVAAVGIVSSVITVISIVGSVIGGIVGPAISRLIITGAAACHCSEARKETGQACHPESPRKTGCF
jgi:hypothetical protein